jgi:hypothetical protein
MAKMGAHALDHGLPELPQALAPGASVPVAYWKSAFCAFVMFLSRRPNSAMHTDLEVWHADYERINDEWSGDPRITGAPCWFGPDGPSGSPHVFEGSEVILGGWRASDTAEGRLGVVWGWQSPDVSQISLVQGDHRVTPQVIGHFGAWLIGSDHTEPWTVEARNSSGDLMGSAQSPRP